MIEADHTGDDFLFNLGNTDDLRGLDDIVRAFREIRHADIFSAVIERRGNLQKEFFPGTHTMEFSGAVKDFKSNPCDRVRALFTAPVASADLPRTGQNILFKIMWCLEISAFLGKLIDDTVTECNTWEPQKLRVHSVSNTAHHDG